MKEKDRILLLIDKIKNGDIVELEIKPKKNNSICGEITYTYKKNRDGHIIYLNLSLYYENISVENFKNELLKNDFLLTGIWSNNHVVNYRFTKKDIFYNINMKESRYCGNYMLKIKKSNYWFMLPREESKCPEINDAMKWIKSNCSEELLEISLKSYRLHNAELEKALLKVKEKQEDVDNISNFIKTLPKEAQLKFELLKNK